MKLIITGCEHVGKTTLADGVSRWLADVTGYSRTFHDHFTVPSPEVADEDRELFMKMSPAFKERFQRYQIAYHGGGAFLSDADHLLVGYHIEEAVFAPLYYGYGGQGRYAERSAFARHIEQDIMKNAPDTILVLLTARPEVIRERMRREPLPRDQKGRRPGILREEHRSRAGTIPRGVRRIAYSQEIYHRQFRSLPGRNAFRLHLESAKVPFPRRPSADRRSQSHGRARRVSRRRR